VLCCFVLCFRWLFVLLVLCLWSPFRCFVVVCWRLFSGGPVLLASAFVGFPARALLCFLSVRRVLVLLGLRRLSVGVCLVSFGFASSGPVVGFLGSRSLGPSWGAWVRSALAWACPAGSSVGVAVGCSAGADSVALSSALGLGLPVSLFAVGGPSVPPRPGLPLGPLVGFWAGSSSLLSSVARLCSSVFWFAGGPLAVPLRARLSLRSRALISAVSLSGGSLVVAFVAGSVSKSKGSWAAVRWALLAGLSVVVVPCGCPVSCFPASFVGVGSVSWVSLPASAGFPGFSCVRGGLGVPSLF